MTQAELESWFNGVVSIREAFRSSLSKADHATHMTWLNKGRFELDRIEREERTVEDDKASKDALNTALNDTMREQLRKGPVTTKQVVERIISSPAMSRLVREQQQDLAERQLRAEVSARLGRTTVTPPEAEKDVQYHASQPELAFHNIEEFRGTPRTLTYVDAKTREISHIPYTRSHVIHREYSLKQHESRMAEADKRYQIEKRAHLILQPLVKKFGDLEAWELWQKKSGITKKA